MELKSLCIENLDFAIELANELKSLIAKNEISEAIDVIADLLFVTGQTLLCINRVEFTEMLDKQESYSLERENKTTAKIPSSCSLENLCLQLVDMLISNFEQVKQLIEQNQLENAENIIATTLSGRILSCINSLKEDHHHQIHVPAHGSHFKKR